MIAGIRDYAIVGLDQDGKVLTWNSGAEQIHQYKADEIIGKHFSCLYPKDDIANGKPEKELSLAITESPLQGEGWRIKKDGSKFWADFSMTAMRDNSGNLVGVSALTRDLTRQKQAEEDLEKSEARLFSLLSEFNELNLQLKQRTVDLEDANQELEAFSYSVSHDLRAPLRAINGFVSVLQEDFRDKLDISACEHLDTIARNAIKMGQLIDDLIAFSRASRQQLTFTRIDMAELTSSVFHDEQKLYPDRVIQLKLSPMPEAFGDRAMIKQVITNLVSNAIKFTKQRDIAEIECGGSVQNNECVYYVKDNGIGFDMQFVSKLFQPFQRLHTTKEFEGTGIGLAFVQRIVRKHGGEARAEGILNVGTTIYFTLPLNRETGNRNEIWLDSS